MVGKSRYLELSKKEYLWNAREKGKYEEFSVVDKKTNPGLLTLIII
jgi:hypothetical protein